jgi:hypothetical protein
MKNERVHKPKDKWFDLDQKTIDLWDQIEDTYKSVILGHTKSSSSAPPFCRPPSKPPVPPKQQCCNINLHEMFEI